MCKSRTLFPVSGYTLTRKQLGGDGYNVDDCVLTPEQHQVANERQNQGDYGDSQ